MTKLKNAALATLNSVIAAGAVALASSTSVLAAYSIVNDYDVTQKIIPVKLIRGEQVEYGKIVYRAWVRKHEQETGDVSKPLTGHIIDDRQCNWQISGHMQRQYFVTSITGKEDSQPASAVDIPVSVNGKSNGLASFLDHDPCGDYRGQIEGHVASARKEIVAQFDQKMTDDLKRFHEEYTGVTVVINP